MSIKYARLARPKRGGTIATEMAAPDQTTELLRQWRAGDQEALDRLIPHVYSELRRLAQGLLRDERPGHTLRATALVNEAYLRLIDQRKVAAEDKAHFLGIAASMMRRILVDYARKRRAGKRGWDHNVPLVESRVGGSEKAAEILALHGALEKLAERDPRQSQLVELKYFAGLSIDEIAAVMKMSPSAVKREWRFARAWLRATIGGARR